MSLSGNRRDLLYFAVMAGLFVAVGQLQSWNVALSILNLCLISAVMALGVNIQWGYAGLFNVGIMGFAALGGLAVVLVSAPPVRSAWEAGGAGVLGAGMAVLGTAAVGPVEDFRVTGTEGELIMERGREGRLMLFNGEHPGGLAVMSAFEGKAASYGVELHDFSCAVLDGKEPDASPAYSLGEFRTALAMYRSVESGRWEKVWD